MRKCGLCKDELKKLKENEGSEKPGKASKETFTTPALNQKKIITLEKKQVQSTETMQKLKKISK